MYIPKHFRQEDPSVLAGFIRDNSFGTLVSTVDGVPFATPLPFLLDSGRGPHGTLQGHMARANPHWRSIAIGADVEILAMFHGPHGYISPSWYCTAPSVPTWNYMAVHAYGTARIVSSDELLEILRSTVLMYEQSRENPWRLDSLSEEYVEKMACGVVGFEIEITRVEGKFKMSQNRSEEDIVSVIEELDRNSDPGSSALAKAMSQCNL